ARRGTPREPADLYRHDCLGAVACGPAAASAWRFEGAQRGEALAVRGRLRSDDKDCLREAALAGAGVAHLAGWLVSQDIAAGRLVALLPGFAPPVGKGAERAIHAVRMPGRSHDAKARLFIAHLKEVFGEVPYWDRRLAAGA